MSYFSTKLFRTHRHEAVTQISRIRFSFHSHFGLQRADRLLSQRIQSLNEGMNPMHPMVSEHMYVPNRKLKILKDRDPAR